MQVHLLNILWLDDSPYGTFVDGDSIDVYYDTSTNLMVVKNNTVTITSGDEIPTFFTYNSQSSFAFKSERIIQGQVCDDTDLLIFKRKASFPYIGYTLYLDHPSCDLVHTVCDVQFNLFPTVTDASSLTSNDGSITVSATSSNGSVKYRINADFEYNDSNGQTSGTFSNLSRGTYLVFARDSRNCLKVISVSVGVSKDYQTLYQLEYYSDQSGYHQKTEILQDGYAGEIIEVKGAKSPTIYRLRREGEKDSFYPVLASEVEFTMISETNYFFEELFTNDPEKFRIRHSIDTGSGYDVVWYGKMLPNQYEESYTSTPYPVSVIASDGLPELHDIPFLDSDGNKLFGKQKQIKVIAWILGKLGLGLSIRTATNIYAVGMNITDADDPLDQAYVDVSRYYLIDTKPSCYDVLIYTLDIYGAQIIQWGNYWNILRREERVNDFDYRVFDSIGDYVSNSTYSPLKEMKLGNTTNRLVWADRNQSLRINPGFGSINLMYNLGLKDNLIENGEFQTRQYTLYNQPVLSGSSTVEGAVPDITGFEIINNGTVITRTSESIDEENVALGITVSEAGGYIVSDTIEVPMRNSDQLKFELKYKIETPAFGVRYVKLRMQVKYGAYYLQTDGTWSATEAAVSIFVKPEDLGKYITQQITAYAPTSEFASGEEFYIVIHCAYAYYAEFSSTTPLIAVLTANLPTGYRTELLDSGNVYYYELQDSDNTNDGIHIIRPADYSGSNERQWIRVGGVFVGSSDTTTFIDSIKVNFLSRGKRMPEVAAYRQGMENNNNLVLNKIIYHGSLLLNWIELLNPKAKIQPVSRWLDSVFNVDTYIPANFQNGGLADYQATAASNIYSAYLRDSNGDGYTTWSRSALSERKSIEQIYIDMYCAQYNSPWRHLSGSFIADILFSPIDTMVETMDNDRKYVPVSMEIDFRFDMYSAEFPELKDATEAVAFTTGFTTGFNA